MFKGGNISMSSYRIRRVYSKIVYTYGPISNGIQTTSKCLNITNVPQTFSKIWFSLDTRISCISFSAYFADASSSLI